MVQIRTELQISNRIPSLLIDGEEDPAKEKPPPKAWTEELQQEEMASLRGRAKRANRAAYLQLHVFGSAGIEASFEEARAAEDHGQTSIDPPSYFSPVSLFIRSPKKKTCMHLKPCLLAVAVECLSFPFLFFLFF